VEPWWGLWPEGVCPHVSNAIEAGSAPRATRAPRPSGWSAGGRQSADPPRARQRAAHQLTAGIRRLQPQPASISASHSRRACRGGENQRPAISPCPPPDSARRSSPLLARKPITLSAKEGRDSGAHPSALGQLPNAGLSAETFPNLPSALQTGAPIPPHWMRW